MDKAVMDRFVKAADVLRANWLNDGHELSEKWRREFRKARDEYDAARQQLQRTE